jgi:LacI family transcriptional regulator
MGRGMGGIQRYARQAGWVIVGSNWPLGHTPDDLARRWDVGGVLAGALPRGFEDADADVFIRCRTPLVIVSTVAMDPPFLQVSGDSRAAGRLAAEHLIERAFEHLAYVWLGSQRSLNEQRDGFREAAEQAGCEYSTIDFQATGVARYGWDAADFRRWLAREVKPLAKPLGLFVDSDLTALEAVEACLEGGMLVPEQVAVVGCWNDVAVCEHAAVPITSVDMNDDQRGYEAAAMLDLLLQDRRRRPKSVSILPRAVITRQSSDILAVPHLEVAKAVRFIWENYADSRLGVPDIVEATAMSKPGLNKAFNTHLKSSIGKYLAHTRLEKARRMLRGTKMTVEAVAAACGYGNAENLANAIRRAFGMSPRAWRNRRVKEP